MFLKWKISAFNELSPLELHQVLQLRAEVFVVEQNCVYQDIDGKDPDALHLIGYLEHQTVAYARLFDAGRYFKLASVGRVVVKKEFRNKKWGHDLMRMAITEIHRRFGQIQIEISAQLYLHRFYEFHGFESVGATYLEDDIPHIKMIRRG